MRVIGMACIVVLLGATSSRGEEVLFEDNFDKGLSNRWQVVGLKEGDFRIRDGGLEMRVQPGKRTQDTPRLQVVLPFTSSDTVIASVEVTILDRFTEPAESAGLCLIDDDGSAFSVRKQRLDGYLVLAPGNVDFIGPPGAEGAPNQYTVKYWPANDEFGPLRIIVRSHYAFFQVGPSIDGKYLNFFHSAIRQSDGKHGFSLIAAGGPEDAEHWVRFDNFRVKK